MEDFKILNGGAICIQSLLTKRFIKQKSQGRLNCQGCHPYLVRTKEDKSMTTFIVRDPDQDEGVELKYCDLVYLVSEEGWYLTPNPSGDVFMEKVDPNALKTDDTQRNLMKFRKWQILNFKTLASKKIIVTTDEALLKSNFGHFLKIDKGKLAATNNLIADDTTFSIKRADVFNLPNWSILRPYQSNLFLTSDCVKLFSQNNQFFTQLNYSGSKLKTNINFSSPKEAERLIIEEVVYSLLSNTGQFIQRFYDNETGYTFYEFSNSELFDISLVQMVNRLLPLSGMHDYIKLFEELNGTLNKNLQMQGFCDGLYSIRKEYYMVVNMIEGEMAANNIDIQKLWYYLQTSFKIFESVTKLLRDIDRKKDNTLTVLYNYMTTAIDR